MDKENINNQRMNKLVQSGKDRARDASFVPRMRTFSRRKFTSNPLSTINPNLISSSSPFKPNQEDDNIDFDDVSKKKTTKKTKKTKATKASDPFEFIPNSSDSSPDLSNKKSKYKSKTTSKKTKSSSFKELEEEEEEENDQELNNTIEKNYYFKNNEKVVYIPPKGTDLYILTYIYI
jgi:hypothetical protein